MAEWLQRAGSSPDRGGHKNFCGLREPSDYVSFRKAVERQRFHTLNAHDTTQQHSLQTHYTLELHLSPFLPGVASSFPPE